jgi:hypothetical protein
MAIDIKSQTDVSVVPAWIINGECVKHSLLVRAWYEYSTNVRVPGPLTE